MKWSWKLGEIRGIPVYVHATFFLVVVWVVMVHWGRGQTLAAVASGLVFTLSIFGCVVLHELGHALTAQRYGIRTRDITLLPIGGVARLERMPEDPMQELKVALAGPAVNLVIAGALAAWVHLTSGLEPIERLGVDSGSFLERLMAVNAFLALFNLIPAFPMDGGRVLRAVLAFRLPYTRATQLAANLGQAIALLFGFLGLFSNPFLIFIALFVWIGATQEAGLVQTRYALGGVPVASAMITRFATLAPSDPLVRAVQLVLEGFQSDFPVVQEGRVVGILTRRDLVRALAQRGEQVPVGEVMRSGVEPVEAAAMLDATLARLGEALPVVKGGRLVGLLTAENLTEFLMIQAALERGEREERTDVPARVPGPGG